MSQTCYFVKEPQTVSEIEALLRIRYSVFREHELRFLVRENEYGLDVDAWDKHAWHIGLYKQIETECQPIGYMRFIHNGPEHSSLVYKLSKKYPDLGEVIAHQPPTAHPFLVRYGELLSPELLTAFHMAPGNLAEVSRFALLESEKSRTISRFIVESVIAIFHLIRVNDLLFEVAEHHVPFYQHYGYRTIAQRNYEELSFTAFLLHSSRGNLAQRNLPRIRRMAEAFEEAQEIWLNPDEPENFYAPAKEKVLAHHLPDLNEA